MSRFRKPKKQEEGAPAWMVTFSDLVTLLLVFFVLLYSFSVIDKMKFQQFIASFQGSGILEKGPEPLDGPPEPPKQDQLLDDTTLDNATELEDIGKMDIQELQELAMDNPLVEVYLAVISYLETNQLQDTVEVRFEKRGIALEIKDRILFDSGSAYLKPNARKVLNSLAPLLKDLSYMISVEGHTDDRPIHTSQFPSNWELSVARALSVVKFFIEDFKLDPQKFAVVGLGEYHPVVPNNSPGNWQLNRRVIIVVNAEDPFKSEVLDDGRTE